MESNTRFLSFPEVSVYHRCQQHRSGDKFINFVGVLVIWTTEVFCVCKACLPPVKNKDAMEVGSCQV
jgi:hypothetical protein